MPPAATTELERMKQTAINLFYGWGYNFYRQENQLRADDLMVRAKLCELLSTAKQSIQSAESAYRRVALPPPSREHPRPVPEAIANVQRLETLAGDLGALEGQIRALPVPEIDRMTQRFRGEAQTLSRLVEADQSMVGQTEFLRALLADATPAWMLENAATLRTQITSLEAGIRMRRDLLSF